MGETTVFMEYVVNYQVIRSKGMNDSVSISTMDLLSPVNGELFIPEDPTTVS